MEGMASNLAHYSTLITITWNKLYFALSSSLSLRCQIIHEIILRWGGNKWKYVFYKNECLHAMPINNITHSACYTVEMGVSAGDLTRITLDNNHTAYMHICLQGIGCVCVKNYPPEMMQPSSSTRATIVSLENQNDATIVKAKFFFCHYYIVWEPNNASDARGQSWNENLKPRWIPGGSCSYTSGTKRKHFAALSSPWPWWRWLQLQPSCGSPQSGYPNHASCVSPSI